VVGLLAPIAEPDTTARAVTELPIFVVLVVAASSTIGQDFC
jgi:hypothetical protein